MKEYIATNGNRLAIENEVLIWSKVYCSCKKEITKLSEYFDKASVKINNMSDRIENINNELVTGIVIRDIIVGILIYPYGIFVLIKKIAYLIIRNNCTNKISELEGEKEIIKNQALSLLKDKFNFFNSKPVPFLK